MVSMFNRSRITCNLLLQQMLNSTDNYSATFQFIFCLAFPAIKHLHSAPIHQNKDSPHKENDSLLNINLSEQPSHYSSSISVISSKIIVEQMMGIIVENKGFDVGFERLGGLQSWTVDSVCEVLRAIPRIFFQSERSIGCQKGFRRRAPLRQRNLWQEAENSRNHQRIKGPAAFRDPLKVQHGVDKALEFYFWVEERCGFSHTEATCREMARTLAKGNSLKTLWRFLHEMERRATKLVNTATVTCVIKVLGEEGLVKEALAAFYRMKQFHCKPDVVTYNTIICALCRVSDFKTARFLLNQMEIPGSPCPPDTFTYTILISFYCKHSMQTGCRKAVRRRIWEANHLFRIMLFKGFIPDVVTYNCLIDGLCKTYRIDRALELLKDMQLHGCFPNRITYDSFIRYYSAVNEIDKAVEMLHYMKSRSHGIPTSSSYTPIIHALCEAGRLSEASDFLIEMVDGGSIPRTYTYNLVRDSLNLAGGADLPDDLCKKIDDGINVRYDNVKLVKPIMSDNQIRFHG